jgi:hypothetical protein
MVQRELALSRVAVEKVDRNGHAECSFFFTDTVMSLFLRFSYLVRGPHQLRAVSQESHQSLQVLGYRCQVKLFAHELDPA